MTTGTLAPVASPRDIGGPWMTQVVRGAGFDGVVHAVCHAPVGNGQVADTFRLTLSYASGAGPTTMVGKFASQDHGSARLGGAGGLYEREVRFYRDLAPRLDVATARPYAALISSDNALTLLLEDLAPARTVDQLVGCTRAEVEAAVHEAAALHAGSWRASDLVAEPWLRSMVDGLTHMAGRLPRIFERLEGSHVFPADQLAAARALIENEQAFCRALHRRTALWHQDFRLDNLLFRGPLEHPKACVLDWQTVAFGPSIGDLSLLLGTGLTIADRRRYEEDLVSTYHAELVRRGVDDYGLEECWDAYRLMAVHGVFAGVVGAGRVKRTERGDRMWQNWLERHLTQAEDLGSWELLSRV